MKEPEVLFTYEEALPWIREYYHDYSKKVEQEAKCRKIMERQRKRVNLREKICGIATIIVLDIIPIVLMELYGTTGMVDIIKFIFILLGMLLAKTII